MGYQVIRPRKRGGSKSAGPDCFYVREDALALSTEAVKAFGSRAKFVTLLRNDDGRLCLSFSESPSENSIKGRGGIFRMPWLRGRYDIAKGLYRITGREGAFHVTNLRLIERQPGEG